MGSKVSVASPIPAEFAAPDINRLLFDINSVFNPLHQGCQVEFQVSEVKDGYVFLSLALPEGLTRAYITLLESLNQMVRFVDVKTRAVSARRRVVDPAMLEETRRRIAALEAKVVSTYDSLLAEGCSELDAISRTNAALKSQGEVLATYEWVKGVLRKAGKFRKRR